MFLLNVSGIVRLSEVGTRGLLNLGKKVFGPLKLGKFDGLKELDRHYKWIKNDIRN